MNTADPAAVQGQLEEWKRTLRKPVQVGALVAVLGLFLTAFLCSVESSWAALAAWFASISYIFFVQGAASKASAGYIIERIMLLEQRIEELHQAE